MPFTSSAALAGSPLGHAVIAVVGWRACGSDLRRLRGQTEVVEDLDDDLVVGDRTVEGGDPRRYWAGGPQIIESRLQLRNLG